MEADTPAVVAPAVPRPRRKRLMTNLLTSEATEDAVRKLTRAMAVEVGDKITHDEVLAACVSIGGLHIPLLVQYVKERGPR